MTMISTVLNVILALTASVVCLRRAYLGRTQKVRMLFILSALTVLWFAIIYSLAIIGVLDTLTIGPVYLRPALTILLALFIALPIADEPQNGEEAADEIIESDTEL